MKKLMLFFCLFFILSLSATIINVPADQLTIQEGIIVAVDGDTVLVQPNTYFENINYNGKNITVASLFLTTHDSSYITQTVIDGNQNGSVVTFENDESSSTVLCGFTITNGSNYGYGGGGIYCYYSNPSLNYLTISGNFVQYGSGGGIHCNNSSPVIENVTIAGNTSTLEYARGGGIYLTSSSPHIINVTITNNYGDQGGGIYCSCSSPIIENVEIINNYAPGDGFFFRPGNGGGISCLQSTLILKNVTISNNYAYDNGGGIFCIDNSSLILKNGTITNNFTWDNGGGIFAAGGTNLELVNCILWNDSPQEIYFYTYQAPNTITLAYSDIQGGEESIVTNGNGIVNWLEGNIDSYPLFVGTGVDPYSLLEDSPCIDAGIPDTTGLNLPPWDIIDNMRIWDGDGNGSAIIDMGAYEYGAPPYVEIDDNVIIQTPEVILYQNYPNPFNPTTTISFSIPNESEVDISIYNIKGQKVKQLVSNQLSVGQHSVVWNGDDESNNPVSSGVYLYKLNVNGKTEAVKKCLLLK